MIRHFKVTGYCLAALALLLPGCGPEKGEPPEPLAVKVVLLPYISFAPYFIAAEEGFFEEQGLAVEFVRFDASSKAVPALVRGDVDVSNGGVSTGLLNAVAREGKIRIVADKGHLASDGCTYTGTLISPQLAANLETQGGNAFKNLKIAVNPSNIQAYYASEALKKKGLTMDDVESVNLSNPAKLTAMTEGTLDAAVTAEPWVTRIIRTGKAGVWMPAQEVIPDHQTAVVIFGPNFLEKNVEAGRNFMVSYLKGVRRYNQGKTERNLEILAKHTGLDRALLEEACWPAFRNDGRINTRSILDFQAWAMEMGALDAEIPEDGFWDPGYIDYANRTLE